MLKRDVEYKYKVYTVTFDEYDEVDTVQNTRTGKYLKSTNPVVKAVLNKRVQILRGLDKVG